MPEELRAADVAKIERTGELPSLYVNSVESKVSFFDIQLVLGFTEEIRPDQSVLVKNLVTIVMSPQHAKALREALIVNIEAYERAFGVIQMPTLAPPTSQLDATAPRPPSSRSRAAARRKASRL